MLGKQRQTEETGWGANQDQVNNSMLTVFLSSPFPPCALAPLQQKNDKKQERNLIVVVWSGVVFARFLPASFLSVEKMQCRTMFFHVNFSSTKWRAFFFLLSFLSSFV